MAKPFSFTEEQLLTKEWVTEFVIPNKLCPFAGNTANKAGYAQYDLLDPNCIAYKQIEWLVNPIHPEYFNQFFFIFPSYKDKPFSAFIEELKDPIDDFIYDKGFDEHLSSAGFHPSYLHDIAEDDDEEELLPLNDPRNYTNRSPYPMVHVFKKDGLLQFKTFESLKQFQDKVVSTNDKLMSSFSETFWEEHKAKYLLI